MNQFSNLDAQSEVSTLAKVLPVEMATDDTAQPVTIEHKPAINFRKLVKHNLGKPLAQRISADDLLARSAFARVRGNLAALRAQVEHEIAPLLQASRDEFDNLMAL